MCDWIVARLRGNIANLWVKSHQPKDNFLVRFTPLVLSGWYDEDGICVLLFEHVMSGMGREQGSKIGRWRESRIGVCGQSTSRPAVEVAEREPLG
jgi:hypothetical protein